MNFGIITHYDVHNHGAILQLNALIKVLSSKGIKAQALRFDKNYDFLGVKTKNKYNISIRSIGIYLNYLRENGLKKTLYNIQKKKTLDLFKSQEELIGKYYTETGELSALIIGSDEVFALHTGPTPAFFGHACPSNTVFSYAGSFGPTKYEDIVGLHCLPFVKSGLKAMKGVSVRDRNSFNIVSRILGKDPVLVCDPVLLYGYEKERKGFKKIDLPPYLLVYAYDTHMNDPFEVEIIKQYAKANGLETVSPGFYHPWCDRNINVDPVQLLEYFANADCVVTDTFHGSVMSILTNRELAVKTRGNSNKLFNLLDEYGLTQRILTDTFDLENVFQKTIDYQQVNQELARRRKESMDYLDKMITDCQ